MCVNARVVNKCEIKYTVIFVILFYYYWGKIIKTLRIVKMFSNALLYEKRKNACDTNSSVTSF